jgi:phytoene desaturase
LSRRLPLGGEIRFNSEIAEISTSGDKVTGVVDGKGRKQVFDLVASNADVFHTYSQLLGREPGARRMRKRLAKMNYSMSLFLIYFGTRRRYPNLLHHNIMFGPRYRELLQDIFSRGRLAEDFSLYLHAPSQSDPNLAPPGCETF